jgi:hypothetical protein
MTASCWILLRIRNVSTKSCREIQNTHFKFSIFFSEIKLKKKYCESRDSKDNTAYVRFVVDKKGYTLKSTRPCPCTHTHTQVRTRLHSLAHMRARVYTQKYVIFIAFLQQNFYRERASMLSHVHNLSCWLQRGTKLLALYSRPAVAFLHADQSVETCVPGLWAWRVWNVLHIRVRSGRHEKEIRHFHETEFPL